MKSSVLVLAAAALLPSAMAAKPKLNQYATMDDCNNDRNILFHAAPVSGRCYNLDGKTGAFFWATGGMLNPRVYYGSNCNGIEDPLSTNGRCFNKGPYNSFKMW
ncbi:hypothetical protein HMPREF1624_02265 [Sporothrix schenckii ATCC 58251]|uniref:Cyanovirin-N domain-containing protein n=1 Tax=Sporothrix schenckii (strain ATCC 58251 / de Perez 2211183) TaxID=1391915 RepID=U7PZH1_SPOS1|nr:hypothetical protein HMPREF1624_02265 [Sporothrix schenckii ATCC 58251]